MKSCFADFDAGKGQSINKFQTLVPQNIIIYETEDILKEVQKTTTKYVRKDDRKGLIYSSSKEQ